MTDPKLPGRSRALVALEFLPILFSSRYSAFHSNTLQVIAF
jgi:hypothetical protein